MKRKTDLSLLRTPTLHGHPFRAADFATLTEALDYAAQGETGANFYTGKGELYAVLPYSELRECARLLAGKLLGLGLQKGDRVAMIAETDPHFLKFFFACQYAGLIPVALPASVNLGGHTSYVAQLRNLLRASRSSIAMAPTGYLSFLKEASGSLELVMVGDYQRFEDLPAKAVELPTIDGDDMSYFQYTSGSTRFPRGVMIKHRSVASNLGGIVRDGVKIGPTDRCVSWLPFYHDMGLVGLILVPVAAQISVDYLDTREFAKRPRQWLNLMSQTRATISFSPSFGYDLAARRLRPGEAEKYDLSNWRVAGIGAEMIRPETLAHFAEILAPSGFDPKAFLPCYGMAECSLGVSFAPLSKGFQTDCIDVDHLSHSHQAVPVEQREDAGRARSFVKCGRPLPEYDVEIRDEDGNILGERHAGTIYLRGESVMSGYFDVPEITAQTLSADGWLNTGDVGYLVDGELVITGRAKDLIIINGRNIWPQDLEYIAESQPEVRIGDALAFSVPSPDGELCVLAVQCREQPPTKRAQLIDRLSYLINQEMGISCYVALVPPRSLPRTSSGKLSRAKARQNFIESNDLSELVLAPEERLLRYSSV